ncbi:hypothetical protein BHE74_00032816 [Ensete ventricosum]|nr:hypothetical protein BHE74_00032816 [Ensete ventricosum]
MKVDFPRWEEGDPIGWISRTERYFRFYRTADAIRVEIAIIHLEGDTIQDKLFLKCHIQLNQQWILMQCSLISGYFHDFTKERTMMLKVFPDDDLGSTTHDRKKKKEKDIHMTPIAMMPSISMLALPEHGNVFILGADTSRVGIDITLMQDGRLLIHTEASPTLHMRFLKGILIGTKFKIWLDTGLWHERGVSPKELQFMLTPAHAKKKWPLDKLQNGRKIEDLVFLHLQPDQ